MSKNPIWKKDDIESFLKLKNVRPAVLQKKSSGDHVECGVCERRCTMPPGEFGFCKTRMNIQGKLYTLVYGDISSIAANPIEKKPFFHFWPGSHALTVGSWGCNFVCPWCQNWDISKCEPRPEDANYISPEKLVNITSAEKCQGTSISFNEPTLLLEYSLDLFPLTRKRGLYNTYVSNGYMTSEALSMLKKAGMDAIKFDVKGDSEIVKRYCGADAKLVWKNVSEAKRLGMHVEVVVLVIPDVNDDDTAIREIVDQYMDHADANTPLHFTQFYPTYQMTDRKRTPVETLEKAHRVAKEMGVRYAYVGNIPGHEFENTYCPNCGKVLIERFGFDIVRLSLREDDTCPKCGEFIPIVRPSVKR